MNMSYCRFQNTYIDLMDCYESMEEPCSKEENKYRYKLIELCQNIVSEYEDVDRLPVDEDEE
jgi:hypothetical protein